MFIWICHTDGRVTGAERWSKCGNWMMVCRWWLLFPEPLATGPSPVGWLKAVRGVFLSLTVYFCLSFSLSLYPSSFLSFLLLPPHPPRFPLEFLWKRLIGAGKENKGGKKAPKHQGFGWSNLIQSGVSDKYCRNNFCHVFLSPRREEDNISPPSMCNVYHNSVSSV